MAQTNRWGLLAATSLGLALCGCAHEVESPSLTFDGIEPNLVCNAQRVEPVAELEISGSGFNPMPTNVLADPALLVLPSVELRKTQNLTGGAASGTEVVFSGNPEDDLGGNVSWDSAEQLRIRFTETPPMTVDDGIYEVTVKNPDGNASATRERALAVVSPPVITSTDPTPVALCVAQGPRDLTVNGQNLLVVDGTTPSVTLRSASEIIDVPTTRSQAAETCEPVPGTFAGGTLELCSQLTLTIPEGASPVTAAEAFDFAVTSPSPASCRSSEPIKAVIVPAPTVAMVTSVNAVNPLSICVDQGEQTLTIQGTSFARVSGTGMPTVTLAPALGDPQVFTARSVDVCAPPAGGDVTSGVEVCESLTVAIPPLALPAGDYTLTVTNPDPIGCSSSEPVTLTVNSPPVATAMTPSSVCSGGSRVVISGQGFQTGARAELRCNAGPVVSSVNTEPNADGTQLTVTFGPGVEPGSSCEVVVVNPDSCEDRPLPHQTATGTEGPILFFTDPPVVPGNVNTPIFLFLTSLEPPYTVSLVPTGMTTPEIALTATLLPGRTDRLQATIPAGTAANTYDIIITDGTGCFAIAPAGVTVTDTQTIQLDSVNPTFGTTAESNAITIFRVPTPVPDPLNVEFTPTPRAFLIPQGTTDAVAIQLESVTFVNADTLTAVVPDGVAPGVYDLIVVDSMGNIGLLVRAYTAVGGSLPVIDEVVPQSIVDQGGQVVTLRGSGFDGATLEVECATSFGTIVTVGSTVQSETCDASGCTLVATINSAPRDSVCLLRVVNADGSFGEFSAIGVTNSSLNLPRPTSGTALNVGRRALVGASAKATAAARFVYAIGGDEGPATAATPLASVEHAFVDVFGAMQSWSQSTEPLPARRSFAGGTAIGRYMYVFGGSDGATALTSGARAMVLSPEEAPAIQQIDLCLTGGSVPCFGASGLGAGLAPGEYSYRVAALIDANDPVNLGGETLASDPTIVRLTSIGDRQIAVELTWSPPADRLGAPLSGVTGYRIYRTSANGIAGSGERLLAEVNGTTLTYIDDGSDTPGTVAPPPLGSTSAWQALPAMNQARNGPASAALRDPGDPSTWYVYALLGKDAGTEASGGTAHTGYEFLTVTVAANERQSVSGWSQGNATVTTGRWLARAWAVDESITSLVAPGEAWLYVGGGTDATNTVQSSVQVGLLATTAAGQLDNFTRSVRSMGVPNAGFGAVPIGTQVNAKLLVFGGSPDMDGGFGGELQVPIPTIANWNNEGWALQSPRYLAGTAVQSAFIFLIGGQTSSGGAVTSSTEFVVW